MADFITQFAADEGVSRQNFNNRITQANTALSTAQSAAAAAQTTANTAVTNAAAAKTAADNAAAAAAAAQTTANGKANASHTHAASQVTAGTLGGQVRANISAVSDLGFPQVRDICAGPGALTPGVSPLQTGMLQIQYE
ncbi:MAG: hypothetical protein VB035_09905 [Candidatus Fimivivens sp.]|nr:hypothetical protein [Candidatus Fimivivens sp.]